jgi:hypothetical protein
MTAQTRLLSTSAVAQTTLASTRPAKARMTLDPVAEEKRQKERDEKMKQLHLDIKDAGKALYQTERDLEAILKEVTAIKKEQIFWVLVGTKTVEQLQFTKAGLDKTVQELTDMLELVRAFHVRVVISPKNRRQNRARGSRLKRSRLKRSRPKRSRLKRSRLKGSRLKGVKMRGSRTSSGVSQVALH